MKRQLLLSTAAAGSFAAPSANAGAACNEIFASIPGYLAFDPLGLDALKTADLAPSYTDTTLKYWDAGNWADRPACIVFPASADHVSVAVKALQKYPSVPFAIKSGGHQFNRGWSSTDGGVLLSFRPNLATTTLSADGTTCQVGSGTRWLEAITVLDPLNKTIVGGRIGDVGVGGYTVGGGLSYLTSHHGFASDNVINFEAVLPNGTIVNADESSNRDLFWALRGGGNAFAIVTKFTLRTHPMGDIWGGQRLYTTDKFDQLFGAITDFVALNKDPRAAVIPTFIIAGPADLVNVAALFMFYDGAVVPADVFAGFTAIPALVDTTRTQRYPELLNIPFTGQTGFRTAISMQTFPNLKRDNMVEFLKWNWQRASDAAFVRSLTSLDLQLFSIAIQPMPVLAQNASVVAGGDVGSPITPDPDNGDKVWVEYDVQWLNGLCDEACPKALQTLVEEALAHQKQMYGGETPTNYKAGDVEWTSYNPLFMNDAGPWQDVLKSYGADNYERLKEVHQSVDPTNFLTTRQQGFFFRE